LNCYKIIEIYENRTILRGVMNSKRVFVDWGMSKETKKLIIAMIIGFLVVIIPYYLFFY